MSMYQKARAKPSGGTGFDRNTRIAVIGAGPAGLSAAYFLKERGYREVTVLEKQGRVGGLCRTITEDYHCFDLGANYLTPDYKETIRLAKLVGAELYPERPLTTLWIQEGENGFVKFREPWEAVTAASGKRAFLKAAWRYIRIRRRLRKIIDRPGFSGLTGRADLCVSFMDWLKANGLEALQTVFEVPITLMGYGYLHEIPAPHALKYMRLRTFIISMLLKAWPPTNWIRWPKRLVLGFQRLWEAISWQLNVRTRVKIRSIERSEECVRITLTHQEQMLNEFHPHKDTFEFDYVILACPFTEDVLNGMLDLSEEERGLFSKIKRHSYCLTSFLVSGLGLDRPIAGTIPVARIGTPWVMTKQFAESDLIQFYTRVPDTATDKEEIKRGVLLEVRRLVERLGGTIQSNDWHTYDQWPYFEHITGEDIRDGFYEKLEAMQGSRRCYYAGGIMDFELVENVVAYSKHLVRTYFPPV